MTNPLSKAHAKRILRDWIEDADHAASVAHWPDLLEAYQALRAIAESPDEPSALRIARARCSEHGLERHEGCKVCDVLHGPVLELLERSAEKSSEPLCRDGKPHDYILPKFGNRPAVCEKCGIEESR